MKMRYPKVPVTKTVRGVKMKKMPDKKKMSKDVEDSISETIAFVVKGISTVKPNPKKIIKKKVALAAKNTRKVILEAETKKVIAKVIKKAPIISKKVIVTKAKTVDIKKKVANSPKRVTRAEDTKSPVKAEPSTRLKSPVKSETLEKTRSLSKDKKAEVAKEIKDKKIDSTKETKEKKVDSTKEIKEKRVDTSKESKDKKVELVKELKDKKVELVKDIKDKKVNAPQPKDLKEKKSDTTPLKEIKITEKTVKSIKSKGKPPTKIQNIVKDPIKEKPKKILVPKKNLRNMITKVKPRPVKAKPIQKLIPIKKIKEEPKSGDSSDEEIPLSVPTKKKKLEMVTPTKAPIKKPVSLKNRALKNRELGKKKAEANRSRKMKLFSMWNGPKRHRVASLNAAAKVHCLYENESRAHIIDQLDLIKREPIADKKLPLPRSPSPPIIIKTEPESPPPTRTLRCVPGLRAVGKMWDMHDSTSSDDSDFDMVPVKIKARPEPKAKVDKPKPAPKPKPEPKSKEIEKEEDDNGDGDEEEAADTKDINADEKEKKPIKRRKRAEIVMDLKDMVVRKRMASLNATAILAASYSVEKRGAKGKNDYDSDTTSSESEEYISSDSDDKPSYEEDIKKEEERKLIEVRTTPNKKVAVIVNQDTDVTITGVYVNSTTRSTHHEGYCSIAGMQYRISATSHTQTAATAVATETILQSASTSSSQENSNAETPPSKSYTPLDALSNMQPPAGTSGPPHVVPIAHHHLPPPHIGPQHVLPPHSELSPLARRHGCPSAFSAPAGPCVPPPPHHHLPGEHGYMPGYYQPAGPLITVPHGHSQAPPVGKSVPSSEPSPTLSPPIHQPPPPSSAGDSSDSEVIITSVTTAKEASAQQQQQAPPPPQSQQYRFNHYPPAHSSYPYSYPPQYYPAPPPASAYSHHDICYPPYSQHKYMYTRRYLPPPAPQYYQPTSPDLYNPQQNSSTQQVVTATSSASGSSYPSTPTGPPPPTLLDTYPPPPPTLVESYPPPHYYTGYGPAPPPACYTHSPPSRPLNYINATYQSCPCPMQSCPKNVHTGPLAGDSKRSNISIAKESVPLPPVALALPLEPASATGPPSPARGSAGMPPPPSPAGATYQPPPPKQETPEPSDPSQTKRKARVGKAMVRNTIAANHSTMLLMCHPPLTDNTFLDNVKREVVSPKETEIEIKKQPEVTPPPPPLEETQPPPPEPTVEPECLKVEEKTPEESLPCVNTVAENVKVKNMKRKLSTSKEPLPKTDDDALSPSKQAKLDKNGSYKDLIKKTQTVIKINNGKRKLIKFPRIRLKKNGKRKLSPTKEENGKRLKASKPLTASNMHNSKQNHLKGTKSFTHSHLIENKEPMKKTKRALLAAKAPTKKIAALMDNLVVKNNVDRTIESVISCSHASASSRTIKALEPAVQSGSVVLRTEKCKVEPVKEVVTVGEKKKSTNKTLVKSVKVNVENKIAPNKRKSKCKEVPQPIEKVPRRSLQQLRWSNGWMWEGEPFDGKVFLNSDETTVNRKCYPAMRHEGGDKIEPRDCVLLKAGQRKNELPFVAKIAALWENPEDGEMMLSLLWYYRPEHTEQGRLPTDQPDEVFASRHKDSNSVACIEDKCYVLTFNEYCRYRKNLRRLEEGIEDTGPCIPTFDIYPRTYRQPPTSILTSPDMVFFCRRVYDFRQKRIVKNPS